MAIMNPNAKELGKKLCEALGLPKNVIWLELRVAVDEAVTVKCEYFPEHQDGKPLEAVFAEYQVVKKPTNEPVIAQPAPMRRDHPPEPPAPPLTRCVREGVSHSCPKCRSSMVRKWWIFGPLKCVHPECGYVDGSEGVQPPKPWPRA